MIYIDRIFRFSVFSVVYVCSEILVKTDVTPPPICPLVDTSQRLFSLFGPLAMRGAARSPGGSGARPRSGIGHRIPGPVGRRTAALGGAGTKRDASREGDASAKSHDAETSKRAASAERTPRGARQEGLVDLGSAWGSSAEGRATTRLVLAEKPLGLHARIRAWRRGKKRGAR